MTENRVQIECIFFQFFASCLLTSTRLLSKGSSPEHVEGSSSQAVLRELTPETIDTVPFKELNGT
jgi:hypothetical protein